MVFATDGIITRVSDVDVSDKLLNILTPEKGRIAVMVKGGRSPNSQFTPISQLFAYCNFEISERNSMYWLKGGSVINPFYDLSTDISKIALATYLCALSNEMTDEDEECEDIMRLLLNSLYLLGQDMKEPALIKSVFELRSATMSGYMPELSGCVYCHAPLSELMYLDVMGGRLICTECMSKRNKRKIPPHTEYDDVVESGVLCPVSMATLTALRYIVSAPDNKAFSFALKDEADVAELSKTTETYILNHLGRSFDALDFYNTVK